MKRFSCLPAFPVLRSFVHLLVKHTKFSRVQFYANNRAIKTIVLSHPIYTRTRFFPLFFFYYTSTLCACVRNNTAFACHINWNYSTEFLVSFFLLKKNQIEKYKEIKREKKTFSVPFLGLPRNITYSLINLSFVIRFVLLESVCIWRNLCAHSIHQKMLMLSYFLLLSFCEWTECLHTHNVYIVCTCQFALLQTFFCRLKLIL